MMSHLGITARVPCLAVGNDGEVGGVDEHTGCIIFLLTLASLCDLDAHTVLRLPGSQGLY